ncbi:MAG TPA: FHA domain-containing protein [Pirellulaceae bacterium]|jgi:hypothetical protein
MDAPILPFDRYNRPKSQTSPALPAVWLEITRGRVRQPIRPVPGPVFLIGAAADCDLVLGDATFPETYAYLLVQDDSVTIRRVGDEPELLVNGEPIETAELATGDRIAFGPFELAVQMPSLTKIIEEPSPALSSGNWPWLADLAEI